VTIRTRRDALVPRQPLEAGAADGIWLRSRQRRHVRQLHERTPRTTAAEVDLHSDHAWLCRWKNRRVCDERELPAIDRQLVDHGESLVGEPACITEERFVSN
jgi:hypothetical protein